jgi:hypothetical protein
MAGADRRVHSRYSLNGDEWTLKALGVRESYMEPEHIYRAAMSRKMGVKQQFVSKIEGGIKVSKDRNLTIEYKKTLQQPYNASPDTVPRTPHAFRNFPLVFPRVFRSFASERALFNFKLNP